MDHLATSLETCTKSMGVPKITIHTELKSEHTELTNKKIISGVQRDRRPLFGHVRFILFVDSRICCLRIRLDVDVSSHISDVIEHFKKSMDSRAQIIPYQ